MVGFCTLNLHFQIKTSPMPTPGPISVNKRSSLSPLARMSFYSNCHFCISSVQMIYLTFNFNDVGKCMTLDFEFSKNNGNSIMEHVFCTNCILKANSLSFFFWYTACFTIMIPFWYTACFTIMIQFLIYCMLYDHDTVFDILHALRSWYRFWVSIHHQCFYASLFILTSGLQSQAYWCRPQRPCVPHLTCLVRPIFARLLRIV